MLAWFLNGAFPIHGMVYAGGACAIWCMVGMGIAVYGECVGTGTATSRKCANRGEYENLV